jgi:dihydropteroate synthase
MIRWEARDRTILAADDAVPGVMGIVNITPDSFSDGGRSLSAAAAAEHAQSLIQQGADLLDLGAESTRPGSDPVPLEEELRRLLPVLDQLGSDVTVPVSIDTSKARVAALALDRGASIINDVTALRGDLDMVRVIADSGAAVVLMHMLGIPRTMQNQPHYDDVVSDVVSFLAGRIEWCESHGIPRSRIAIDPGIGFGKSFEHNLEILRNLKRFANLGCTLLVGTSRKGLLGTLTGRDVSDRAVASTVSSLAACVGGARVVRVHDVTTMVEALKVWTRIRGWGNSS